MVTIINRFRCDTCLVTHTTPEEAQKCEAVGVIDHIHLEVGDFVEIPGKEYSWHNKPDSIWTRELTDPEEIARTHHGKGRYVIRAIITDIRRDTGRDSHDGHHPKYSIYCPEPPWFDSGARKSASAMHVWTRRPGHYALRQITPSPELIAWRDENFHEWIGKPSTLLL